MFRTPKSAVLIATMCALSLLFAGTALADDIVNSLDSSVDSVAEVMALNAGGSSGTTTLYVRETGGDGKNGCNLTGSTSLTLNIASSNTATATVSPSSVTFASCGDTKAVTVTPVAAGTATIAATQSSNTTGATFNLAPATFTVTVAPAAPSNTAPTISVSGVTAGASYNKGAVSAASCTAIDKEDGTQSFPATLGAITGTHASDGIGNQTASCSYTDTGGLTASASVTYSIVDPSPPSISYTLNPGDAEGHDGWYRSDATLTWSVSDNDSPSSLVSTGCVNETIDDDQEATEYSCSATSAGGSATPVTVSVKRDATGPTDVAFVGGPAAGSAQELGDVAGEPSCTASDATSGLAEAGCVVAGYSRQIGEHTLTATARDNAGNITTQTRSYTVVDTTDPAVTITLDPDAPDGANEWYRTVVDVTVAAQDLSGIDEVQISLNDGETWSAYDAPVAVSTDAVHKVRARATDVHDNTGTANVTFKRDATGPTDVAFVGGPAPESSHYFGAVPAAPTCTATDTGAGLSGCVVTGYSWAIGTHTITATATDDAGNTSMTSRSYSVRSWTTRGFFSPVDMGTSSTPVWNTAKSGSTIPLKFEVFAGTELKSTASIGAGLAAKSVACPTSGLIADEIEMLASGTTALRFDATADHFIYNWKTPSGAGCYEVTATLADGTRILAKFSLRK